MLEWPPRDIRAFIALIASIVGAGVLTGFSVWLVKIVRDWNGFDQLRITIIGNALYGVLLIMGLVIVGLGLAINRRSMKGSILGASFEASGGDDQPISSAATPTSNP